MEYTDDLNDDKIADGYDKMVIQSNNDMSESLGLKGRTWEIKERMKNFSIHKDKYIKSAI